MQAKHLEREIDEKNQGRQPNVEQILYIICIFHSFFFTVDNLHLHKVV